METQWEMTRALPALLLTAALAAAGQACADDDHERALRLRQDNQVLPLEELLRRLDLSPGSRVLEVESEYEHGRALYEIEYVDGAGRVRELLIDARTGQILEEDD